MSGRSFASRVGVLTLRLVSRLPSPVLNLALRMVEKTPLARRLVSPLARRGHRARLTIRHGPAAGISFSPSAGALVYVSGRIEAPVQDAVRENLRAGDVFFDVGANVGFYTLLAARMVGPGGRVASFEPNPANLEGLRENIAANGFSNVTVVPKAVSARSGTGRLAASVPFSSIVIEDGQAAGEGVIEIALTSLDDYVTANPDLCPSLVKIDAEGHELHVIKGMAQVLDEFHPKLIVEMHGTNREVGEALRARDYALEVLETIEPLETAPHWVHVLALPRASLEKG
jgi:FkbM family methyltransferase